ncbi:hypothetical protein [Flavobacterium ajazii]|uniref:hypothetical protein n=1 Tax=Flavobacterium ajazii TaxID=2692318 RepID=UPI0013D075C7|nr:hypothetical protein [Flavobacterium ajazii]
MRKIFYRKLFYIGLCIIPITLFADNKGIFRLVPLPFFLFGMYQLMQIVALSQIIIDDFFPPKNSFEKITKPFDKFVYYFSSTLFFISLLCLIFEITNFDNTINGTRLFWTAGFVGILIAILLTAVLKIKFPSVYYESKRRYVVHFGLFVGFFLLSAAVAGFVNHHYADSDKIYKRFTIISKGISGGRSKEYYIHLIFENNNEERFSIGKNKYNNFEEDEEIELCLLKGRLGFDYVTEFNKISK